MFVLQGSLFLIAVCQVIVVFYYIKALKLNSCHLEVGRKILGIHELGAERARRESALDTREDQLNERLMQINDAVLINKEEFDRISKNLQQRELLLMAKEIKTSVIKNRKKTTKK